MRETIDLLDPNFYAPNPHEAYTWMREHEPVFRDEKNELWGITRHADVRDVELDDSVFVSGRGYRAVHYPDETNMIAQDDPQHAKQRRLVRRRFTPPGLRDHETEIGGLVSELVDTVVDAGKAEVIDDLAAQLPCRIICRLLGLPEDDWPTVKRWSEHLMQTDMAFRDPDAGRRFGSAAIEIHLRLVEDLLPDRRREPRDDLISVWAHSDIDGEPMNDWMITHETGLFVAGGAETTRTTIAHGLRTLCDHPDQWDAMAADPDLVPTAVDEIVRWVTPLNNFIRTAVEDTEVRGQPIAEGDKVILLYPSANRDEEVFDDPFTFDLARNPNPHLAFGFGTHHCLGANLAKLELRALFRELTSRLTNLRPVAEPDVEPNIFARAVRSFRLAFDVR